MDRLNEGIGIDFEKWFEQVKTSFIVIGIDIQMFTFVNEGSFIRTKNVAAGVGRFQSPKSFESKIHKESS